MGWLSSGGTPFAYRMSIPVANPSTTGDRKIVSPFPAWYLLAAGKILQAGYQDVHVTKADGTTELPCGLNGPKNQISIDYASLAAGRTTVFVYYGHASAAAPTANRFGGNWIDWKFEKGVAAAVLDPYTWAGSGTAATGVYDHSQTRTGGQLMEAKITGPASGAYGGFKNTEVVMSADGSEIRTWEKAGQTNNYHRWMVYGNGNSGTDLCSYLSFHNDGNLYVYTQRTKTGYTTNGLTAIGTYDTNWREYRVVLNFSNNTYQASYRTTEGGSWTQLKAAGAADYDIPFMMSGNQTNTTVNAYEGYNSSTWWLDNIRYANGGIVEDASHEIVQVIAANDERDAEGAADSRFYVWGPDIDATYIDSANADTFYALADYFKCGIQAAGGKTHLLLKYFEGVLPLGTVDSATLNFYAQGSDDVFANLTLKAHRFLNVGVNTNIKTFVASGWSVQLADSRPTWNKRFQCGMSGQSEDVSWQTAGAVGANEVDLGDGEAPSCAINTGYTPGYKSFALPAGWITDWASDEYSQGVLIKDSTDSSGAANRTAYITPPSKRNCPVLEVYYSALNADQLKKRKMSTDAYAYYATFPTQNRYIQSSDGNGFAVMMWNDMSRRACIAYISPEGRIHRVVKGDHISWRTEVPTSGIYYDPDEKRYWVVGQLVTSTYMTYGYSDPYVPTNWTWKTTTVQVDRVDGFPKNGVLHIIMSASGGDLKYYTYTRSTDTLSSATTLSTLAAQGTMRTLGAGIDNLDVMTGAGEITLSGASTDYPAYGIVKIGTELFWYTGKGVDKLTGVTRACRGTTAGDHSIGANVSLDRTFFCYHAVCHDAVKACMHVVTTMANSEAGYGGTYYFRHYYADAAGTWKDETGATMTLPLDQRTERLVHDADCWSYCSGIIALDNGDFLATLQGTDDLDGIGTPAASGAHMQLVRLAKLANAGTTFSRNLLPSVNVESSMVDIGDGNVAMTGLDDTSLGTQVRRSEDYGDTWSAVEAISTYVLAQFFLWASGVMELGDVYGRGYMYATHYAFHGAIVIDAVQMQTIPQEVAAVAGDEMNTISWTM